MIRITAARVLRVALPLLGAGVLLAVLISGPDRVDATATRSVLDPAGLDGPAPVPLGATALARVDNDRTVVVRGSGWGHSVGMSQYGAHAKARAGKGFRDILGHYYPGTAVEEHPAADRNLRVGLFRNRQVRDPDRLRLATVERRGVEPDQPVQVRLGDDEIALPPGEVWTLRAAGGDRLRLDDPDGAAHAEGPGPATVHYASGDALLRLPQLARSGQPLTGTFRWGSVEVAVADGEVRPTLVTSLEQYLRGLAEMPSSWGLEALKAQAVAGRTYAVRMVLGGLKDDCDCHLGTTPHDQAYAGWEQEAAGERWKAAVEATAGRVATYEGELAWTYYSSSHGGRTEAAEDSWAYDESQAQPYLVSVDDPWSLEAGNGNPRASWEVELPAAAVAGAVGLATLEEVEITERTDGGSPATLRVSGIDLAGNPAAYHFRGWRTGIAASDLKLAFRELLPSQQITAIELVEP